jgi:hypothetical protein
MSFPSDKEPGDSRSEAVKEDAEEQAKDAQPPPIRLNLLLLGLLAILWLVVVACKTLIEINRRFPKSLPMTSWQHYVYSNDWDLWLYNVSYLRFRFRFMSFYQLSAIGSTSIAGKVRVNLFASVANVQKKYTTLYSYNVILLLSAINTRMETPILRCQKYRLFTQKTNNHSTTPTISSTPKLYIEFASSRPLSAQ